MTYHTYEPVITSYDYDAILTEDGQPTEKFFITLRLLEKYSKPTPPLKHLTKNLPLSDYQNLFGNQQQTRNELETRLLSCDNYIMLTDILDRSVSPLGTIDRPIFVEKLCEEFGIKIGYICTW